MPETPKDIIVPQCIHEIPAFLWFAVDSIIKIGNLPLLGVCREKGIGKRRSGTAGA